MGRDERPKRGLEALADPQDQGATVKKKKETRMSREASNLGLTAHQVRHQTGRSNIQSSKWASGPKSDPKMTKEAATARAKTASQVSWSEWDAYRAWRNLPAHKQFSDYDFKVDVHGSMSRDLAFSRRHAIRFLYERIYGAPPEEDEDGKSLWNGPEGTMTLIRHRLFIPEGSTELVRDVMREASRCLAENQPFNASYKHKGRPALIQDGTVESKVVCV